MKRNLFKLALIISCCHLLTACKEESTPEPVLTKVNTDVLANILEAHEYRASAQALSLRNSDIAAEINAIVASIIKDVGDTVTEGDALIALDCRETESIKQQAEATLAALKARESLARQQYDRAKRLRKSRSVSEEELNQKQSTLNAAVAERKAQVANLEIASLNVERCSISAPFTGIITARFVQQGELIMPSTRVLHLVDHENLQIQSQIPADAADTITEQTQFQFISKKSAFPIKLISLAAVIDSRTQTQAARFEFTDVKPKAGTLGQISWNDQRKTLPIEYILKRNEQFGVFYAENNIARFHLLPKVAAGQATYVDLPMDTQIITQGRLGLKIDETIEIKQP